MKRMKNIITELFPNAEIIEFETGETAPYEIFWFCGSYHCINLKVRIQANTSDSATIIFIAKYDKEEDLMKIEVLFDEINLQQKISDKDKFLSEIYSALIKEKIEISKYFTLEISFGTGKSYKTLLKI